MTSFQSKFNRSVWPEQSAEPQRLGIAVSGGGDSIALLRALHDWTIGKDISIFAITVDHGLRPEAAEEARFVANLCATMSIPHDTVQWANWDGLGNKQNAARQARRTFIIRWARDHRIDTVALGHTQDDQAETLVMRLARGSGVDGLSAMAKDMSSDGVRWVRPLLEVSRSELRDYLRGIDQPWYDDPSNDDPTYDRVRTRQVIEALDLDQPRLAATARRMQMASAALAQFAHTLARNIATVGAGSILLNQQALQDAPEETRYRLLSHGLQWVSSSIYRPRFSALCHAWAGLEAGRGQSLHGCLLKHAKGQILICRELHAVATCEVVAPEVWDSHWVVDNPAYAGFTIRALGEDGLRQSPDWRLQNLPRVVLLSAPSLWQNQRLCHAPLAGVGDKLAISSKNQPEDFFLSLLTH
ncbi:MAG: tRNA lysidine(34) synthetase TilS [Pseudoruegeria sp.]